MSRKASLVLWGNVGYKWELWSLEHLEGVESDIKTTCQWTGRKSPKIKLKISECTSWSQKKKRFGLGYILLAHSRTGKENNGFWSLTRKLNKTRGDFWSLSTYDCSSAYLVFCLNNCTSFQDPNSSKKLNYGSHSAGARLTTAISTIQCHIPHIQSGLRSISAEHGGGKELIGLGLCYNRKTMSKLLCPQ